MIDRIIVELGPWNWMVLGFVLIVLEMVLPGVFLIWIGIAALIVGAASLYHRWEVWSRSLDDLARDQEGGEVAP